MSGRVATPHPTQPQRRHIERSAVHTGPRSSGMVPASSIHSGPQLIGNRALHRMLAPLPVQPKLTVSRPDDEFEREADRVADDVMRMPAASPAGRVQRSAVAIQRACTSCDDEVHRQVDREDEPEIDEGADVVQAKAAGAPQGGPAGRSTIHISRMCADCAKQYDERVARKTMQRQQRDEEEDPTEEPAVVQTKPAVPGPRSELEANIQAQQGGGQPLPAATREDFEERFGADFGHVRVHADSRAAATAQSINAKAFTVGHDIAFNHGQYAPDSRDGQHLLAHELTHVIQQRGSTQPAAVMTKRQPTRVKTSRIDVKSAAIVMGAILSIVGKTRERSDPAQWKGGRVIEKYRELLTLWDELTYGDKATGSQLQGEEFVAKYERARDETAPIAKVLYARGGKGWQKTLLSHYDKYYTQFEKRNDSHKRILELSKTTVSFWASFDAEPVSVDEFLMDAKKANSGAMVVQRGDGLNLGTARAGNVFHAPEERLVLWASYGGLFFEEGGQIYKQSQAGFSDEVATGAIIKAAQDVGPFVALLTAIVDIAISLIPGVGVVYDVMLAAKAAAEGRWKDAAMELLPGGAVAGLAKIGKATKAGRAVVRGGAKTVQFVGKAVSGAATFIGKGFRGIGRSAKRGLWLVSEGAGGKKVYHFMDDADPIWRHVDEAEAKPFINCSTCKVTQAGKGQAPPATDAGKAPSAGGAEKVEAPRAPRDVLSVIQNIDKTKSGALKELAGKIHGARAQGTAGQAIAIVEVQVIRKGKQTGEVLYVAASNASAPLTRQQRQLLKAAGIQIAPRAKGVKEVAHAEPHIRAWVERFATKTKAAQVRRWGISAGEKGPYICAACRQIAQQMGGVIEEFSSIGKTY